LVKTADFPKDKNVFGKKGIFPKDAGKNIGGSINV
jgi:hypothetical protein